MLMKITCSMCTAKWMIPRDSHSTQIESLLIGSTKAGKKSNVIPHWPGMTFEQHERATDVLTAGISNAINRQ